MAERGEPVSVFTNTSVRPLTDKPLLMSEWQMLNVKICSAGGFYTLAYSACAKPRRDANKNVVSKVNLRSSSVYRNYSYPGHLLCQMKANSPEVEFQGTISKLSKRNKIS